MERVDRSGIATFFVAGPIAAGSTVSLGAGEAQHARVRRLALGERVRLVDGSGVSGWGPLVKLSKSYAAVDVDLVESEAPPPAVHLMVPIADRERMLWLAEKATELGIASWRPVMWRRSKSVSPRGEGIGFQEKVRARMTAALTQSGGSWLPTLFPDAPLERAILAAPERGRGLRFLLDQEGAPMLLHVHAEAGDAPALGGGPLTLALGPEGGLEGIEREALRSAGFVPVSLGDRILRFETAGLAALAIVRAALTASSRGTRG